MSTADRADRDARRQAYRAMREEIPSVTPARDAQLKQLYPVDGSDTPAEYKKISPEAFFDGD